MSCTALHSLLASDVVGVSFAHQDEVSLVENPEWYPNPASGQKDLRWKEGASCTISY